MHLLLSIKSVCIHMNDDEMADDFSYCWKQKFQGQGKLYLGQGVLGLVTCQHVSLQEVGWVLLENFLHIAS